MNALTPFEQSAVKVLLAVHARNSFGRKPCDIKTFILLFAACLLRTVFQRAVGSALVLSGPGALTTEHTSLRVVCGFFLF